MKQLGETTHVQMVNRASVSLCRLSESSIEKERVKGRESLAPASIQSPQIQMLTLSCQCNGVESWGFLPQSPHIQES